MKKACFITTSSATLQAFVLETANFLHQRSGFDVTLICDEDADFAAALPSHIHYIPVAMRRGVRVSGLLAPLKLMRIFKRQQFDLVQYSTPNASLYAALAAKAAQVPVRLYCQWGIRYVGLHGLARQVFKRFEKIACSLATDIRAVSFKNMEFAVREGLYKAAKAQVLGQGGTIGVDLSDYDLEHKAAYRRDIRKRYGIGAEFVFGFVGRLSRDKGANELLQAFRRISTAAPAKLLCIGSLEAGIDTELSRWAQTSPDVVFTGQVGRSEINRHYAALDCHVHPSYREGFGMVLQESAAMGCAIITTDIPGASEVMEAGASCLLVQPGDVESLEAQMKRVMQDAELRELLGRNARKRVERHFDRRKMLEILRKDYERLLHTEEGT
jgi:glycosyltransferase involved in cell wall biosynthesis